MLRQVGIDICSSFAAWMDHVLLNKGQAYTNHSGFFYKQTNTKVATPYTTFASPFRQFVYDQSVTGAVIPSGIYINNIFAARGTSGVGIDYLGGRVWTASGVGNPTISGNYSVKDFNIYSTTKTEEELVFNTRYHFNSTVTQTLSGLAPDKIVAPCVFITYPNQNNEMDNLGGETWTKNLNIRAIAVSNSDYELQNLGSFFTDRCHSHFSIFDVRPLNASGDYNNGVAYNYTGQLDNNNLAYINNIYFTKFSPRSENNVDNDAKIGFLEFEVEYSRSIDRTI